MLRRLALGGMAELYLASASGPKGFKRRLVLKKILPQFADNPSFIEMFLSEARIAGQLSHPNLAQVYEVGEADGTYFIAMEYVDGPNLRKLSHKARQTGSPFPLYLAARIVAYACDGLGYAHEYKDPETGEPLRIIHRDISPDNIVIAYNGSVKVLDFGIAKATSQHHHTKTGVLKGKIAYMAPEQLARKPMDHRADIYSLGVVLYELLAGARPYDGQGDIGLLHARVSGQPLIPLAAVRPDVPDELRVIVEQMLAKDPGDRPQTCHALQAELESFIHQASLPIGTQDISRLVAELQAEPEWGHLSSSVPAPSAAPPPPRQLATPPPEEPDPVSRASEVTTNPDSAPTPAVTPRPEPTVASRPQSMPGALRRERGRRSRATTAVMAAAVVLVAGGMVTVRVLLREAPPSRPPAPAPGPAPAPTPPVEVEPASPGPAAVDAKAKTELRIETTPRATVRVGRQQGPSPFTVEVEPGDVRVEVFDQEQGFSKVDWIKVQPGEQRTRQIKVARVEVLFRSVPEAQVHVDGRQLKGGADGNLTPIKAVLYEGKHEVRFHCVNGIEDRQEVTVQPSPASQRITGNCVDR